MPELQIRAGSAAAYGRSCANTIILTQFRAVVIRITAIRRGCDFSEITSMRMQDIRCLGFQNSLLQFLRNASRHDCCGKLFYLCQRSPASTFAPKIMPSEPITRLRGVVDRWVDGFHHKLDGYHGGRLCLIVAPVPIPNGIVWGSATYQLGRCGASKQPARFRRMGFQEKRKMLTVGNLSIPVGAAAKPPCPVLKHDRSASSERQQYRAP